MSRASRQSRLTGKRLVGSASRSNRYRHVAMQKQLSHRDLQAELLEDRRLLAADFDYGDAPDTYGTTQAVDGARHANEGPWLGSLRDTESNGHPSPDAVGDDRAGTVDDEDGVVVEKALIAGSSANLIRVLVSDPAPQSTAFVDAWIDFDGNGTFDENERITEPNGRLVTVNAVSDLSFAVPENSMQGSTFARVRLSSMGGLGPTGTASNGEVEDHSVFIARSDSSPAKLPTDFRVNITDNNEQSVTGSRAVDLDADGNYVVVWQSFTYSNTDNSGPHPQAVPYYDVYARQYWADGSPRSGEIRVTDAASNYNKNASISVDPDGNFVVAWGSDSSSGGSGEKSKPGVFARWFNSDGERVSGEVRVNPSLNASFENRFSIAPGPDGGVVIATQVGANIYARRFDRNGVAFGAEFLVSDGTASNPSIAANPNGDFVICWTTGGNLVMRRFLADATAIDLQPVRVNRGSSTASYHSVAMDNHGQIAFTWVSNNRVWLQQFEFSGSGSPLHENDKLVDNTDTASYYPAIATMDSGEFVITWAEYNSPGYVVLSRRYLNNAISLGDSFRTNILTTGKPTRPNIALNAQGQAVLVWTRWLGSNFLGLDDANISGQRFQAFEFNKPPVAILGGTLFVDEGTDVTLDGAASYDPDMQGLTYSWFVSGNAVGSGSSLPYTFDDNGNYLVELIVSDGLLQSDPATYTVHVTNVAPEVLSVAESGPVAVGTPVTVDISATDVAGDTVTYEFDFDNDGVFETSSIVGSASHIFATAGAYPIRVRVADEDGGETFASIGVQVGDPPDVLPEASFTISQQTVSEGAGNVSVEIALSEPTTVDVLVPLALGGVAARKIDYLAERPFVVVPAGATVGSTAIQIIQDASDEHDELLELTIGSPLNAVVGNQTLHQVTITDDDLPPTVSLIPSVLSIAENEPRTPSVSAYVDTASGKEIVVQLGVSGTAAAGEDYTPWPGGAQIVLPAGASTATLPLDLVDDLIGEPNESLLFTIDSVTNATIASSPHNQALLTIRDDDVPAISMGYAYREVLEEAGTISIPVRLFRPYSENLVVPFNVTSDVATESVDYSVSGSSITFAPGVVEQFIDVTLIDDNETEPVRLKDILLSLDVGATPLLFGSTTQTVLRIDDLSDWPTVSFSTAEIEEWEERIGTLPIEVLLSKQVSFPITVDLRLAYASATEGNDYLFTQGPIEIPANAPSATTTLTILDDIQQESDEYIRLSLTPDPTGAATGSTPQQTIRILDDDVTVEFKDTIHILSEDVSERHNVTVKLSRAVGWPVWVPMSVGGTAFYDTSQFNSSTDYRLYSDAAYSEARDDALLLPFTTLPKTFYLKIPAGQREATIEFDPQDDSKVELTESAEIKIGPGVVGGFRGLSTEHVVVMQDATTTPKVFFPDYFREFVNEGDTYDLQIGIYPIAPYETTVQLVLDGEPGPGDYSIGSTLVTIPANTEQVSVPVYIKEDHYEGAYNGITSLGTPAWEVLEVSIGSITHSNPSYPRPERTTSVWPWNSPIKNIYLVEPEPSVSDWFGHVFNGYVDDAVVFFDANKNQVLDFLDLNGNGIQDPNEPSEVAGTSGADGSVGLQIPKEFDLNGNGVFDNDEGHIVAVGGIYRSTGLPHQGVFVAPASSTVVNPLTTLITSLSNTLGLAEAEKRVAEAFDLLDVELTKFDARAATINGDANGPAVVKASSQLQDTVTQAASLLSGLPASAPQSTLMSLVVSDIAAKIVEPNAELNLSNQFVAQNILAGVAAESGLAVDAAVLANAAVVIAASNESKDIVPEAGNIEFLTQMAKSQLVAQSQAAPALEAAASDPVAMATVASNFSGEALSQRIADAEPADVIPPLIQASPVSAIETDSGQTVLEFEVQLMNPSVFEVSVDYQTVDGTAEVGAGDYVATSGTLTWNPGETHTQTIGVLLNGDTDFELDEYLGIEFSNAVAAVVRTPRVVGTIANDDTYIYNAPSDDGENELALSLDGSWVTLLRNGTVVLNQPFIDQPSIVINGASSQNNSLSVFLNGRVEDLGDVHFWGGELGTDMLDVFDDTYDAILHVIGESGAGAFGIGDATISYAGVETALDSWTPAISGIPTTVFAGDQLSLEAVAANAGWADVYQYQWTVLRDEVEVATGSGSTFDFTPSVGGDYVVRLDGNADGAATVVVELSFAVANAAPIADDDGFVTNEDTVLSVTQASGLLANDEDPEGLPIRVSAVNGQSVAASTPVEFASATQDSSVAYSTIDVNAANYYGVRFEVTEPMDVDRVGASFGFGLGDGPIAAIVQLDDASDLPDSFDLSTPDVLATTSIPVSFDDSGDRFGELDLKLQPGWYALMIGAEAGSSGALRLDNTAQSDHSMFIHSRLLVPEFFPVSAANPVSRARFIVQGSTAVGDTTITLGSGATVTAASDGTFAYDPSSSFDALAPGETALDTFTYTVTDAGGLSAEATVSVTLEGVNDAPNAVDDSYAVSEESLLSPATSVGIFGNDSDVDGTTLKLSEINGQPITAVEAFDFQTAELDPSLPYLATSLSDTNFYGVRFEVTEPIAVNQVGGNFQFFTGSGPFAAVVSLESATDYPDSFDLSTPDVIASTVVPLAFQQDGDVRTDLNVDLQPGWYALMFGTGKFGSTGITNLLLNNQPVGDRSFIHARVAVPEFRDPTPATGIHGSRFVLTGTAAGGATTITLDSGATVTASTDGGFTYDPRQAFDELPQGDTGSDQFTYTALDEGGLPSTATVNLTINGWNDPATITGPTTASIEEDTDFISGTFSVADVDQGEAVFVPQDTTGTYGRLLLGESGVWSYDLDNAAVQWLSGGQSVADAFAVSSYDGTATANLTITIIGGNDSDTDGVGDDIELAAGTYCTVDGFRDCNQDGVADDTQEDRVATLPNAVTGTAVTIASTDGTTLTNVISTTTPSSDVSLPADAEFPIGFTQFTVELAPETDSTEVTLLFEAEQPFNAVYKFGHQPGQDPAVDEPSVFEFPKYDPEAGGVGAEILPDRIVLHLVDGQLGDLDLLVNGFISDPIGLALVPGGGDDYVGVNEDSAVTFNPLLNDVLDGPLEVTAWTLPSLGGVSFDASEGFTFTPAANANGADEYSYTVMDSEGTLWTATVFLTINPINDVPTVGVNDDSAVVTVDEGATAYAAGTWNDIDAGDAVSFAASVGTVEGQDSGSWTWTLDAQDGPTESQPVTITAIDAAGASATTTFTLGVNNVAPHNVTIAPEVSEFVFAVGALKVFEGQFADVSSLDTHNGVGTYWTFSHVNEAGETIVETATATVTQGVGGGSVSDEVSFDVPGVYHVTLTVTDDDGASTTSAPSIFVVYDPSAGFVTGGGWINSAAGADRLNPEAAGRANFGFVSKYKKGATAPSGQTTFNFKAGDLEFESDSYEWLVVAGARAQFKGVGTINEVGNYGFLLTAIDGQVSGGGDVDKFRIKIWDIDNDGELRYDNQETSDSADDEVPSSSLGGGQILIHTGGKRQVAAALSLYGDSFDTSFSNNSPHAPIVDEAVDFVFLPGDANLDSKVSEEDFEILSANFGRLDAEWTDGDFDGSGIVDFEDFLLLSKALG